MCLPKSAGGYNVLNIRVWNRAAITKVYWDLAQKKDKIWIKWIHTYYIKGQSIVEMNIPQQASWMVRKIMEAREVIQQMPTVQYRQSSIKQIYLGILGNYSKVTWRTLMFHNEARPKARFTMWMQCHGRLLTTDRLANWGIQVSSRCCLCNRADESHAHLFGECRFAKTVWERLMQWIRIHVNSMQSYNQMMAWVVTQAKGKSCKARIMKMVYAEYIYRIWRERNSRIFEETTRTADQIAREMACVCNIRAQGGMRAQMQQLMF
ncbi:PREDICTED: uncharacterized protein LOC109238490 [Nicotiana attenuata]|uniref:uncharacterized protein LOC109238490 n=1 Tax=Nicotiana attenuata TaxID=49451 RepID=UPI000905975D|nr:PREDICTED: uncharacterized protein LOC109238490 [Nicotiana attenuata]